MIATVSGWLLLGCISLICTPSCLRVHRLMTTTWFADDAAYAAGTDDTMTVISRKSSLMGLLSVVLASLQTWRETACKTTCLCVRKFYATIIIRLTIRAASLFAKDPNGNRCTLNYNAMHCTTCTLLMDVRHANFLISLANHSQIKKTWPANTATGQDSH